MQTLNTIKKRKSVRCFKEKDSIPEEDVVLILESARYAPSAKNLQMTEFIIANSQEIRDKLSELSNQNQPSIVPLVIVIIANLNIIKKMDDISPQLTIGNFMKVIKNYDQILKKTKHIISIPKKTVSFAYMDAGASIQNMLLTATELNIDSLWIGNFNFNEVSRLLKLPENYIPLAILCFGHRKKPPFSPEKRSIEERLYYDTFEKKEQDFGYLEECKLIKHPDGEMKNYE